MSDYDYISVAEDSELMTAYTKVMKESACQEIRVKMAEAALSPHWELAKQMRLICENNPDIKTLVNKQIENIRVEESWERQRKQEASAGGLIWFYHESK